MLRCVKAMCVGVVVSAPAAAYAQASIVGTAKDASGAVLPGVTVEASSPALIEKTRSVVTDATGQYAIEDSAARHLHGDVHADGIQHGQARGHRADRHVHRDRQRRHESGRRCPRRSRSPAKRPSST